MVLYYAKGGSFNNWIKRDYDWSYDMTTLNSIIAGLGKIHEKNMVHRDFHIGNILLKKFESGYYLLPAFICFRYGIMWRSW